MAEHNAEKPHKAQAGRKLSKARCWGIRGCKCSTFFRHLQIFIAIYQILISCCLPNATKKGDSIGKKSLESKKYQAPTAWVQFTIQKWTHHVWSVHFTFENWTATNSTILIWFTNYVCCTRRGPFYGRELDPSYCRLKTWVTDSACRDCMSPFHVRELDRHQLDHTDLGYGLGMLQ